MGKKVSTCDKSSNLDWDLTRGHWTSILSMGGISPLYLTKKGTPCPICGGTDRFVYDDKQGTGTSFCRKCPESGYPDAKNGLELYCLYRRINKKEAVEEITRFLGLDNFTENNKVQVYMEKQYQKKINYPAPVYDLSGNSEIRIYSETKKVKILYKNISYWFDWFDCSNNRVGYLVRLANKTTLQILNGEIETDDGVYEGWFQGTYGQNRPPVVFSSKGNKGLIVEGEKCGNFAAQRLSNYSVVSWTGGANASHLTDFTKLPNIPWYIFPDNNEVGKKAALNIEKTLSNAGYKVQVLAPDYPYPDADIEDIPGIADYDKYIGSLTLKSEIKEEDHQSADDFFFQTKLIPLGFNRTEFYFIKKLKDQRGKETKQVVTLNPSSMTNNGLLALAPYDSWFQLAPGEKGVVEWAVAKDKLIRRCEAKGLMTLDDFRRCGFWRDGKDIVFNEGSKVYLNGKEAGESINGAVYETEGAKLSSNFSWDLQFSKSDYALVKEAFSLIGFKDEDEREAALAWCLTALACGIWKSRPHLKVIGPSGVGKSTLLEIMRAIWGGFCERLAGNETEAGVRIKLNNQALPVTFDEAELESRNVNALEGIEALKRLAFKPGEEQVRGTSDQKLKSFKVNFMLAEMAVGAKEQKETNINRQILCHLTMKNRIQEHDVKVEDVIQRIIESNIKEKLIATLYRKKDEIENAVKQLRKELPADLNGRLTETLGLCLATNEILQGKPMISSNILKNALWTRTERKARAKRHSVDILEVILNTMIPGVSKQYPGLKLSIRDLIAGYIFKFAVEAGYIRLEKAEGREQKSEIAEMFTSDINYHYVLFTHGIELLAALDSMPDKEDKEVDLLDLANGLGINILKSKRLMALSPDLKGLDYDQISHPATVENINVRVVQSANPYYKVNKKAVKNFIPLEALNFTEYELRNAK